MKGLNLWRFLLVAGVIIIFLLYFIMSFGLGNAQNIETLSDETIGFMAPIVVIFLFLVGFRIFNIVVSRRKEK